jgi:DNA-binding MarR family transcriptional regulator
MISINHLNPIELSYGTGAYKQQYRSEILMPPPEEINKVNNQIRKTQFPRLVAFADVLNRYTEIVLKDKFSWLQTSALIFTITRGGSLTPSQLARIMLRSNYSVTKIVDGLEKDGLVQRIHNGQDRRSIDVEITTKGLDYIISILKNVEVAENELKSCLSEEELDNLVPTIRKLRDKLIERVSARYEELSADDKRAIFGRARTYTPERDELEG